MFTNNPRILLKILKIKKYIATIEHMNGDKDFQHIKGTTSLLYDYFYLKAMTKGNMGELARLKYEQLQCLQPDELVADLMYLLEKRSKTSKGKELAVIQTLIKAFEDCSTGHHAKKQVRVMAG